MRQTEKYRKAVEILKYPHNSHQELYSEMNRLSYYWDAKNRKWERDDRLADPPMDGVKIRLWANNDEVQDYSELITQLLKAEGYTIVDKSEPYQCRPPKQNESRIYLSIVKK